MTFDPILYAPFAIQLHIAAALCAIALGPIALWRRSRDKWHKRFGYAWVGAMAATAVSSFAILDRPFFGPFSPIHALSLFTIFGLWKGIVAAKQGRIQAHQQEMRGLYFWAMGVAGLFTFLPGRRISMIFFANNPMQGFAIMTCIIGAVLAWYSFVNRSHSRMA